MALGRKTGGRSKGTPNRKTKQKIDEIEASGQTPLDYMLAVMRDSKAEAARRDDMAKAAAPYVHPKLASIAHSGEIDLGVAERLAAAIARVGAPPEIEVADGKSADQVRKEVRPHRDPPRKRDAGKAARKGKRARAR